MHEVVPIPKSPKLSKHSVENHIIYTMPDDFEIGTSAFSDRFNKIKISGAGAPEFVSRFQLTRLNDVLRGCGVAPVSRNLGADELVAACTEAILSLGRRNRDLCESSISQSVGPPVSIQSVKEVMVAAPIDESAVRRCKELEEETKRLRRQVVNLERDLTHAKHAVKAREKETEDLRESLKARIGEDDRRAALAMTTVREQKLGTNTLILINNYQRQMENLERENARLKNSSKLGNMEKRLAELEDAESLVGQVVPGATFRDKLLTLMKSSRPFRVDANNAEIVRLVRSLFGGIQSDEAIAPALTRVDFRLREFENFYAHLCRLLGEGEMPLAKCIARIENRLNHDSSGGEDSSPMNLALARERVVIPK